MELLTHPWQWYVAGPLLSVVMFSLIFFDKNFGISSNLRTMCSLSGAGKISDFFKIDVKKEYWNLAFIIGSIIGGFIAINFLTPNLSIDLSSETLAALDKYGFKNAGQDFLPNEIFGFQGLSSISGILLLIGGGFLVGFGARYAGGCTSGHAISGLSNLQLPSLIAVVGFFIGGLIMVHFIMPLIF